jgi:PleD family two-component response regulator
MPHPDSPVGPHVTVSIGASAVRPAAQRSPKVLIAAADRALYDAKRQGRDCVAATTIEHE